MSHSPHSLYTRHGDNGLTSLADGRRVEKTHPAVEAVGAVDELSAHLGLLVAVCPATHREVLLDIQRRLFAIGARLAGVAAPKGFPTAGDVRELELQADLAAPDGFPGFILPGGTAAAAQAHICRAVCRRAERRAMAAECREALPYLNRLADYLYALSLKINQSMGVEERKPEEKRAT